MFSIPAKRYVRHILLTDTTLPIDFKITALELEILQFLSENPTKKYLARDIINHVHSATNKQTGTNVVSLTGPLRTLMDYGYVEGNGLRPQSYQVNVKGLKLLNKIIGDYD